MKVGFLYEINKLLGAAMQFLNTKTMAKQATTVVAAVTMIANLAM
jgi:hypothetical protein